VIRARGLLARAGAFALGPLELEAPAGAYVAIVGPSGHGKSTLLWALSGSLPCEGELWLGERALHALPPERRGVALVPQGGLLFPHLDVGANIAFGLRDHARVPALARAWGCEHLLGRSAVGLSGGEAMRVALARAMAREPELLLLDEPLSAIDESGRAPLLAALRELRGGRVVVHVTHELDEAVALSTHLGVLREGKLAAFGPTAEVLQRPPSPEVAAFLGVENVLAGEFSPRTDEASTFRSGSGELDLLGRYEGAGFVSVPEAAVMLSLARPTEVSARNALSCTVAEIVTDRRGARVRLEGPLMLWARMERESVAALGLEPGKAVVAVIKAAQVRALG
jgi:molybdopterin-binding protein